MSFGGEQTGRASGGWLDLMANRQGLTNPVKISEWARHKIVTAGKRGREKGGEGVQGEGRREKGGGEGRREGGGERREEEGVEEGSYLVSVMELG